MKNLRELLEALNVATRKYDELKEKGATEEELRAAVAEVKSARQAYDLEQEVRASQVTVLNRVNENEVRKEDNSDFEQRYAEAFFRSLRGKATKEDRDFLGNLEERAKNIPTASPYLQSAVDADGGLIIPTDVQTKINEYKRTQMFDLSTLIGIERTRFTSGTRVFEKLADQTPFANIDEWGVIEDIPTPQFEQKSYSMKSYAGILPVPRQLLQDTDENLLAFLAKFIAKKTLFTRNTKILGILGTLPKRSASVKNIDDLKDILNVELDGVFATGAVLVTNQDGYNYLDKLKDADGKYLLQDDVVNGTGKICLGKRLVVVPNSTLATNSTKAPLFIGDLKEAVKLFDRGVYEVSATEVGGDSWKRNSHDIRIIDRFEVQSWDTAAVISTEIDLTGPKASKK